MLSTLSTNSTKQIVVLTLIGIALAVALGALIAFGSPVIAFALVLGVVAAGIVLSNIEYGLYAVIAVAVLLPFGALPINLGFNPTFLDLALVALFVMWVMRGVLRQGGDFVATPLGVPVLVFLVLAIFSFIAGLGHSSVTSQVLRQFVEVLIAISMFFVIVNTVQSRATLKRVILALILAGFAAAAIGIVLYILPRNTSIYLLSILRVFKYPSGDGILRYIEDDPANPMRAISTSVDPNVLGGLLILVTALAAPQIFARKSLVPRWVAIALTGTMFLCMVLTFSRGALLGLVAALGVIATVRYRPIIAVILLGGIVFLFLPWTQEYISHLTDAFTFSDRATQMRLGEYKDAFTLIARYPFFGVGFGSSPDIDTYIGVSSVYLLMAEEMGLVGLSAFLFTMGLFFQQTVRAWFAGLARDEELAPIMLGLAGALLGAMIGGLVDHYFFNLKFVHAAALFWLYVGLGMTTILLASRVDKPDAPV